MSNWLTANKDNLNTLRHKHGHRIISELLDQLAFVLSKKKKTMTKEIFISLVNLGHEFNYKVYANVFSKDEWKLQENKSRIKNNETFVNREWLFDIHWYTDVDNTHYQTQDLILAAECEWSKNKATNWERNFKDIGYDFQKLLVCNARLRLMITRVHRTNHSLELERYYNAAVQNYNCLRSGDKFLCVCYDMEAERLKYQIIKHKKTNKKSLL